ncbi:MAG: hypothetical protein MH204_10315, partial [Fimbriimonadaceae bacterium]|nr:hypothetical protein [Fimbriimonadaceae bacterium]
LQPLLELNPRDVSDVIDDFGAPTIYQLVTTKDAVPADFDAKKAEYIQRYRDTKAAQALEERRKALADPEKVAWVDQGLKLAYDAYLATTRHRAGKTKDDFQALLDDVSAELAVTKSDSLIVARYVLFQEVKQTSTTEAQAEMKEDEAEFLAEVLEILDNPNLRVTLANLYIEIERPDEASSSLSVAVANMGSFEAEQVAFVQRVEARTAELEKAGKFTKDQADAVRQAVKQWRDAKAEEERLQAEIAKEDAAARKAAEEEERALRAEEERLRKEEEAKAKAAPAQPAPAQPNAPSTP